MFRFNSNWKLNKIRNIEGLFSYLSNESKYKSFKIRNRISNIIFFFYCIYMIVNSYNVIRGYIGDCIGQHENCICSKYAILLLHVLVIKAMSKFHVNSSKQLHERKMLM